MLEFSAAAASTAFSKNVYCRLWRCQLTRVLPPAAALLTVHLSHLQTTKAVRFSGLKHDSAVKHRHRHRAAARHVQTELHWQLPCKPAQLLKPSVPSCQADMRQESKRACFVSSDHRTGCCAAKVSLTLTLCRASLQRLLSASEKVNLHKPFTHVWWNMRWRLPIPLEASWALLSWSPETKSSTRDCSAALSAAIVLVTAG